VKNSTAGQPELRSCTVSRFSQYMSPAAPHSKTALALKVLECSVPIQIGTESIERTSLDNHKSKGVIVSLKHVSTPSRSRMLSGRDFAQHDIILIIHKSLFD